MSGIARIVKECHSAGILLTILCADLQFCGSYNEDRFDDRKFTMQPQRPPLGMKWLKTSGNFIMPGEMLL